MVKVGIVGMLVSKRRVNVSMRVRLRDDHASRMHVLMMFIVPMRVLVLQCFVHVLMLVPLRGAEIAIVGRPVGSDDG
jgi:hypothetical protein